MDPVILFFLLGCLGGLAKSDLKVPQAFYNSLSIILLLSIGIKGGIELSHSTFDEVVLPGLGTVFLGILTTILAFLLLKGVYHFSQLDAIAIATHYGSVSAVTFAVVVSYAENHGIAAEEFMTVILVLLEAPAIIVGVFLAGWLNRNAREDFKKRKLFHEVFVSKSILLLIGGMMIGYYIGVTGNEQLNFFFIDLFKGFLAIFMLEMGLIAAAKFADLKQVGAKLIVFGLTMPFISAALGIVVGWGTGLSEGGTLVLCTLAASASYIAAPAAVQIALPKANPTLYLTASLGVTFPFNIVLGIPIYYQAVKWFFA